MLSPKQSRNVLLKMFRKNYIANLDQLFHVLDTQSRMSVFRRLKPLGYLTSFTDAGCYYTLKDIAKFDTFGLWFYQGVGFSHAGTLKSTVINIVHMCRGKGWEILLVTHEPRGCVSAVLCNVHGGINGSLIDVAHCN